VQERAGGSSDAAAEDRLAKCLAECTCNERTQNVAESPQASPDVPERAICVCGHPRRALAGRAGDGKWRPLKRLSAAARAGGPPGMGPSSKGEFCWGAPCGGQSPVRPGSAARAAETKGVTKGRGRVASTRSGASLHGITATCAPRDEPVACPAVYFHYREGGGRRVPWGREPKGTWGAESLSRKRAPLRRENLSGKRIGKKAGPTASLKQTPRPRGGLRGRLVGRCAELEGGWGAPMLFGPTLPSRETGRGPEDAQERNTGGPQAFPESSPSEPFK
jgi:hypothetical protein